MSGGGKDFSGSDISGQSFVDQNLSGKEFRGSKATRCADTCVPGALVLLLASCVLYAPTAQGSLRPGPHALYVRRTRTSLGRAVRTACTLAPQAKGTNFKGANLAGASFYKGARHTSTSLAATHCSLGYCTRPQPSITYGCRIP